MRSSARESQCGGIPVRPVARLFVLACALLIGLGADPARADRPHDHDRARAALAAGEILPLGTILERVERQHPGKVLDVELERDRNHGDLRWMYRIKLLRPGGERVRLEVDARDGTVIASRARPPRHD